jgi:prophage regulatory protein
MTSAAGLSDHLAAVRTRLLRSRTNGRQVNFSHKGPFTKNGGARTPSSVPLGPPAFAVGGQRLRETATSPRGLYGTSGDRFNSQSELPANANAALEQGATLRRRSLGEALDALQLLTVSDVCRLLRISKPTLWRLRRSGDFPEPTTVTERIFGWRRSELDAWLESRPSPRRY